MRYQDCPAAARRGARGERRGNPLTSLARTVDDKLAALGQLGEQAEQAARQASEVREEADLLAAVQTPPEVPGLAGRIAQADDLVTERRKRRDDAERLEAQAERARDALPDTTRMETFGKAHKERRALTAQLKKQQRELAAQQAAEVSQAEKLQAAERELDRVREALAGAGRAHAVIALAEGLNVGDYCPVCLQPVAVLPHHPAPAGLDDARAAARAAEAEFSRTRAAHGKSATASAVVGRAAEAARVKAGRDGRRGRCARLSRPVEGQPSRAGGRPQMDPLLFEALRQPVVLVHRSHAAGA